MSWPRLHYVYSMGVSDDTDPRLLRIDLEDVLMVELPFPSLMMTSGLSRIRRITMLLSAMHTVKLALEELYR